MMLKRMLNKVPSVATSILKHGDGAVIKQPGCAGPEVFLRSFAPKKGGFLRL
jgi:hypothetical protein